MRSPSVVPGFSSDVYIVLDEFGPLGRAYRETDEDRADRQSVIRNLVRGEFNNPVRIVCFNTDSGTARDATLEIANEIDDWAARTGHDLSPRLREFIAYQRELTQRWENLSIAPG